MTEQVKKKRAKTPGSGRKAGVPNKATAEIKKYAQRYSKAAIRELNRIAHHSESDQARASACNSILDRAYGKPAQAVTGDPDNPIKGEITVKIVA